MRVSKNKIIPHQRGCRVRSRTAVGGWWPCGGATRQTASESRMCFLRSLIKIFLIISSYGPEATVVATPRPLTPPNRRIRWPSVHRPRRPGGACSSLSGVG